MKLALDCEVDFGLLIEDHEQIAMATADLVLPLVRSNSI